jgi:flagellar protein FlgJ
MNVSSLQPAVRASELSFEQLSTSTAVPEKEKVAELARQFEAVLLRQILTEARRQTHGSTLEGESSVNRNYEDMITTRLADSISRSGNFGLATSLQAQLQRQLSAATLTEEAAPGATTP